MHEIVQVQLCMGQGEHAARCMHGNVHVCKPFLFNEPALRSDHAQ